MKLNNLDRLGFGNEIADALNNSHDKLDRFINYFNSNTKHKLQFKVEYIDGYKGILIENITESAFKDFDEVCSNRGMALSTGHAHPYSVIMHKVFKIDQISIVTSKEKGFFGMNERINYLHLNLPAVMEDYIQEID